MEEECLTVVDNPQRGKNMFVVGMLCCDLRRDLDLASEQIALDVPQARRGDHRANLSCSTPATTGRSENLDSRFEIPPSRQRATWS